MSFEQKKFSEAIWAIEILEAAGYEARMAGGCVRDRLLGVPPRDYDVATNAAPDQVCKVFTQAKIKVVPTGFEHGTITLVMPSGPVEVTTLRIDLETFGRHATVALGTSFKEDAARRDFTINAMFENKDGVVLDFFSGQKDLRAGVLRFVGDAGTRIKEDYLRIMRLFRFWARFSFLPADGTLEAICANRDGLMQISQERITYELYRIFESPVADVVLRAMKDTGILQIILPELTVAGFRVPDQRGLQPLQNIEAAADRTVSVLALLLSLNDLHSSDQIKVLATRLRLSKNDARKLVLLISLPSQIASLGASQSAAMALLDQCDEAFASENSWHQSVQLFLTAMSQSIGTEKGLDQMIERLDAIERDKVHIRKADLPINVPEIMKILNLTPGPQVGAVVESLRSAFRNEELFSKPEATAWLEKYLLTPVIKKQ